MTTEAGRGAEPILSRWFQRQRLNLALLRNDDYRRNLLALLGTSLRGLLGLPFLIGGTFLFPLGAWLIQSQVERAHEALEILQVLFAIAALGLGATIYSHDQQSGTFEILWLASGSEMGLLRLKLLTIVLALALPMVPAVVLASWYVGWELPLVASLAHLLVNTLFILALLAWIGTLLPQSWAAGLLGAALLAACYLSLQESTSAFNPFRNPLMEPAIGAFLLNRIFLLCMALILLGAAASRLRGTF